eukprot:CCRYP_008193-RB/>CCRYP_008193-RB protein AED:0.05 eAED:0.05 QI:741/1/1/1/0/0.33/3/1418/519
MFIVQPPHDPLSFHSRSAQCSSDMSSISRSNSFWPEDKNDNAADETASTYGSVENESNSRTPTSEVVVNDDALVDARIDGKIGVRAINPIIQTRANTDSNSDSSSGDDTAFNFISTQSEPMSHISFTKDHDPLVSPQLVISPRMTTKCTVVHGHMTIYTYDSSSYENLQARTIDAIKEDMQDPTLVKQNYVNDVVLGLRFVRANTTNSDGSKSSSTQDPINSSPGYVSSIIGSPNASSNTNDPFSLITFPIMILIALGTILLVLLALFVGTSNRKRSQYDDESSGQATSYEEEREVSITEVRSSEMYDYTNGNDGYRKAGRSDYLRSSEVYDYTNGNDRYRQAQRSDYIYRDRLPCSDEIDRALSRTFSGLSDRATSGHTGNSVYATFETTINSIGDIRIQEVRSYVDDENEECYSIHSVFSTGDGHCDVEVGAPASPDGMHDPNHSSSRGTNKKSPSRRLYSSPTRVFSGQGSPKQIFGKFSKSKEYRDEGLTIHAYLEEDNTLDETAGMEVSLQPFV